MIPPDYGKNINIVIGRLPAIIFFLFLQKNLNQQKTRYFHPKIKYISENSEAPILFETTPKNFWAFWYTSDVRGNYQYYDRPPPAIIFWWFFYAKKFQIDKKIFKNQT